MPLMSVTAAVFQLPIGWLNVVAPTNMPFMVVTPGGSAAGTEVRWAAPLNAPLKFVIPRSPNDATAVIPVLPVYPPPQYPGRYPKWVAVPEIETVWSPGVAYV